MSKKINKKHRKKINNTGSVWINDSMKKFSKRWVI